LTITHGSAVADCTLTTHYALESGLALRSETCPSKRTYEVGTSDVASLSEALWMLLVLPEMGPMDRDGLEETSVPPGIWRGDHPLRAYRVCVPPSWEDGPVAVWRWSAGPLAADMTGRFDGQTNRPAQVYAKTLLISAERTYEAGCLDHRPIARQTLLALTANPRATPDDVRADADGFEAALRACAATPGVLGDEHD
jgi:hypothetical protein